MSIEELLTWNGEKLQQLQEGEEREFLLKAQNNLDFLKGRIAKEDSANVDLREKTLFITGFKDEALGHQVSAVVRDTLYQ